MITAIILFVNGCVDYYGHVLVLEEKVVEAPSFINGPQIESYGPKRILDLFRIQFPEHVDVIILLEDITEAFALLRSESGYLFFPFRLIDVHFLVGYVEVSRQNDELAGLILQMLQMFEKVLVPVLNSILQPPEPLSCVRCIASDEIESLEFHSENSSLSIMPVNTDIVGDAQRLEFCEDSHSRITSFVLRAVPMLLIVSRNLRPNFLMNFDAICFCLVEADDVGVCIFHKFLEFAFLKDWVYAIHVPMIN